MNDDEHENGDDSGPKNEHLLEKGDWFLLRASIDRIICVL